MGLSVLVAKILALTYISAGIAMLGGTINYGKMVEEFERSAALTFVTGFFTIILGMILVTYHNFWVNDWPVLITVIGWLSLVKGLVLTAFPKSLSLFKNCYKNTRPWGYFMIAFGLLFAYFGFVA